jgi:hypothetical protein
VIAFYDVSEWMEKQYITAGGTRNKVIVEHPNRGVFYFKTSLERYKYEFWSEIIASAVGEELGFNTLHYDIAWNKTDIGCLSSSMESKDQTVLIEIVKILRNYDNTYKPEIKQSYSQYTFQFIEKAFETHQIIDQMSHIVETIVFDSLIGNGDRHQENWGFIFFFDSEKIQFSPIYDSGSCLGRELIDGKIQQMLTHSEILSFYINRGLCEIRWDTMKKKLNHFDLILKIIKQTLYKEIALNKIKQVIDKFNINNIRRIVYEVDKNLPEQYCSYKLPDIRKQIIVEMIQARFNRLKGIL